VAARDDAARTRLAAAGELTPLDAVYAALAEAGVSARELRTLDEALDKLVAERLATPAVKA